MLRKAGAMVWLGFLFAALAFLLGAAGVYMLSPAVSERMALKRLVITGNRFTASSDIIKALDLRPSEPLMELDCRKLEKRLEELRFVKTAKVARGAEPIGKILDGTLNIEIAAEKLPVAKVHLFDLKYWLLSDGTLTHVLDMDNSPRFDAARKSPEIHYYSSRQEKSPEIAMGVIGVLAMLGAKVPGQIKEIRFDESGGITMFDRTGFPIVLTNLANPEVSLANIAEILRIVRAEKGCYSEAVLRPDGEPMLRLSRRNEQNANTVVNAP